MPENDPRGLRPGMRRAGRPLLAGDVHILGALHPAAVATISAEGWRHHGQRIAEALAKSPLVPSVDDVEVTLLSHDHMVDAMAAEGIEGAPTDHPFDATLIVAAYRPRNPEPIHQEHP